MIYREDYCNGFLGQTNFAVLLPEGDKKGGIYHLIESNSDFDSSTKNNYWYRINKVSDEVAIAIYNFSILKNGWDYGEGEEIKNEVIEKAIEIYNFGKNVGFRIEPHPINDGGINLIFSLDNSEHFLDIIIGYDLKIDYHHEIGKGINYYESESEENVDLKKIQEKLFEIFEMGNQWYIHESSIIQHIILPPKEDLQANPLRNMEEEYLFSNPNAWKKNQLQLAYI